ncbi:DNA polymerase eta-like [Pistacia vera]|uniref:DNA polymerase eta-like n=1 Tax=Pistacia vera TaxID=55513 RepID=UPI001262C491|nr:DNA polymerase eta-like [Pistacia vera]
MQWSRKATAFKGLPSAAVQYNEWKHGALITVRFEARKYGVKLNALDLEISCMIFSPTRGDEAEEVCPQIELVQVPVVRGKADLITYQNALLSILSRKGQRASIDKVYLDLTDAAEAMLAETPLESLEVVDEEVLKPHMLGLGSEVKDPAFRFSVIFYKCLGYDD